MKKLFTRAILPATALALAGLALPNGSTTASAAPAGTVWSVSLAAAPTTVGVGGSTTLTATTTIDVGPTPFFIEIYDVTTGTQVGVCGSGTTCSAVVSSSSATTQEYVAYIASGSTAFPPPGIQASSADSYVTWAKIYLALRGSSGGWTLSLSAPRYTESQETVTATANADVYPTPYYIEVFDEATGRMIGDCGSGSSCSITYVPTEESNLVAFVSDLSTALPPAGAVASSNVVPTSEIIP